MKLKFSSLIIAIIIGITGESFATTYYVSPTGNDANAGTFEAPFKSLKKALGKSTMTEIIIRGGTYYLTGDSTVSFNKSGTALAPLQVVNYPGERPVFDCSGLNATEKGFAVKLNYWYIRGIDIKKARDNGMHITGSFNVVEFCTFSENEDSGLQLSAGASNNTIINCDSYFNKDATSENADGFACKLDVGTGNSFKGCRAWQNSDDGWDGYMRPSDNVSTTLDSCWAFRNGYLKSGAQSGVNGDGNGFKMGGSDAPSTLRHNMTLTHCVAFNNRKRGFDQNNNKGSMTLYNNTAFSNNAGNYIMNSNTLAAGSVMTVKNCIAFTAAGAPGTLSFVSGAVVENNSWQSPFSTANADFISLDSVGARGPRKADGSLPDINFMHLAAGSDLINGGQNVGLVFSGTAPDLGAFETSSLNSPVYTFTGTGNWTVSANWLNGIVPPASVLAGSKIIIDHQAGGNCIVNDTYTLSPGASLTVMPGKNLSLPGNLIIH
jgi:hypothetical protein